MRRPNPFEYRQDLSIILLFFTAMAQAGDTDTDKSDLERGRYLVMATGCNDCHTAGYGVLEGQVPQDQWLKGDVQGWWGPWGTTYGSNLRLFVVGLSEDQWVSAAKTMKRRPPMPWFNLNQMNEDDLRVMYRFIRSLGDPGEPAPAYLPPDQEPPPPYARFVMPPPEPGSE